jgi:Xaa-Pro aminopeptidase
LRQALEADHLDAFLVLHLPNVFYLTGFTGSNAALLVSSRDATLFTDRRYAIQAKQEVSARLVRVRIVRGPVLEACSSVFSKAVRRIQRVGFEAARVSVRQKEALASSAGKQTRWTAWDGHIEADRAVKDSSEIAIMQDAADIACSSWEEVLPLVEPGVLETDLAAEVEYRMRRKGAAGPAFDTIIASGERSAWPHARASCKPIRKNELVVFDLGAILRGYSSDLTRTVYVGRAPAVVKQWYRAVLEAQQAARDALRPGISAAQVDAAARQVLQRAGLGSKFTHSTGHGLGLEVHEMPRLGKGEKTILMAGNAVTIEPGIYIEGQGGIRIEDDLVVTPTGAQLLTPAKRELLEIE